MSAGSAPFPTSPHLAASSDAADAGDLEHDGFLSPEEKGFLITNNKKPERSP